MVVPVLNEADLLPDFFATLAAQRSTAFELILCDGGSSDGTLERGISFAEKAPFPCRVVRTLPGRGRQMNVGAAVASGRNLLFLHADSSFADPFALASGLRVLEGRIAKRRDDRVAGHFGLCFRRREPSPSAPYFFYEGKARLHRPGCIHGDQGFLLRRSFFETMGRYDESLPFLEDERLAQAVRRSGEWILLPATISTSARRFETEGMLQRQTLNAMILCMVSIGWENPLTVLPELYRRRDRSIPLDLSPFFGRISAMLSALPPRRRLALWYRVGTYVCANAWQLAFAHDQRLRFRRGETAPLGRHPFLDFFDRRLAPLLARAPGSVAAGFLTWSWFHVTCQWLLRRRTGVHAARQGG